MKLGERDPALVGGKAAALGELMGIAGVRVPEGFVVTSEDPLPVEEGVVYAVRSSATAEDLPTASFAGLHDTYLNVPAEAVEEHVRRCRDSLFSERAVAYRERHGIHEARMAVIVQRMVDARVSGVLFTADPVSGNRTVTCVEAVAGLGEAFVSGRVNADVYRVRDGQVAGQGVLTEAQVVELEALGRRIEAHFGRPQDIEWCLADDGFWVVQSRPITTLFPIPSTDGEPHVWLSTGHQQMMTDAMKPLGLSIWRHTAMRPFDTAGGRLWVEVTKVLSPAFLEMVGKGDPLTRDALETLIERGFVSCREGGPPPLGPPSTIENDPALPAELIRRWEDSLAELKRAIAPLSGSALFDFLEQDFQELKRLLTDPLSHQAIMASHEAIWWLNDKLGGNAADTLAQSVPHNVTSEMGRALLDVGDDLEGFLERYGMRCPGEIDITRPRWSERPDLLLPLIEANRKSFAPGEGRRRFERGLAEARRKEREVVEQFPEAQPMIDRLRIFAGYREYPKYGIICRYQVYKQALLREFAGNEDIFYLSFEELRAGQWEAGLIQERREAFRHYQTLTPPRVLTSEGECLNGSYRRGDLPEGALAGLPVSPGTVEGRARVLLHMAEAELSPGDILVTPSTDPSWTPAFLTVAGLVTEVGGLMSHGAVIAREYGLPAVVGVLGATRLIQDGQRIRLNASEGWVELMVG